MLKNHQKYLFPTLLTLMFFAQFFFISPKGEFALNDDWVHTDTAKHWMETGEFRLMPFAGPTFYVPIVYGAALIKVFGFSFTLLRISTLVLTLCLLLTTYYLLKRITNKPSLSFFATLTLWFNPMLYNGSFSFMTDIPALSTIIISIYFFYIAFEKSNPKYLFWGALFSILSAFTRQTGILVMCAAFIYASHDWKKFGFKNIIWTFGIPALIGAGVYCYLISINQLPQSTYTHTILGNARLFGHFKWWLFYIHMYLGIFLLPVLAGWFIKNKVYLSLKFWLIFFLFFNLAVFIRQFYHLQFPYIGNTFSIYGLGPAKELLEGKLKLLFPSSVWGIMTIFAVFGLSILGYLILKKKEYKQPTNFIYLFGFLYVVPILLMESFDRYLLPLFLVVLIFVLEKIKNEKFSYIISSALILIFAVFSVTQTDYYLKWNQTRWQMADNLVKQGIAINQIDAGYEWLGWNSYWDSLNSKDRITGMKNPPWYIINLFWNNKRNYVVSFSELAGYDIVDSKQISGFNPNNQLFLLKKK